MKNVFLRISIFVIITAFASATSHAVETEYFEQPVTLTFNQHELKTVLQKISAMTGVQFVYDEKIAEKSVSGVFVEEPLIVVISRLMKGMNHILTLDENEKLVLIKGFGETRYITTGNDLIGTATNPGEFAEMNLKYDEALQDFERQLTDKSVFVKEAGINRGQLEALYEKQISEFNQKQNEPGTIVEGLDMTREEAEEIYAEQVSMFDQSQTDTKVVKQTGATREELKIIYDDQIALFDQQQNGDKFLEDNGMTRERQKQIYYEQVKKFNEELGL